MKLRKPCVHGWYDGHEVIRGDVHLGPCPGGVFLPDILPTVEELRHALLVYENEISVDPVIVAALQGLVVLEESP